MKRLYEAPAYGPQGACYWSDTVPPEPWPKAEGIQHCDVAVIGGGFTGVSAALRLAEAGKSVCLFEAENAGYGASGRNGGFACLGGSKASGSLLRRRYGDDGLRAWRETEKAAVSTVDRLIRTHDMAVDRHSEGETQLAHTPRAWATMQASVNEVRADYDVEPILTSRTELLQAGMGGPWYGALTIPIGFALDPRKYHAGLARAARAAGARLFGHSPITQIARQKGLWRLSTPREQLTAESVLIATNGYSSEDVPDWLRARTLPVQSSVIVTRPLTAAERDAQGWRSGQMAYDTRQLLHYFRLMPNGRFLFGMRGGLRATPRASARTRARIHADFAKLFPAWRDVEITHHWSGLVCLMAGLTPFAGAVPNTSGLYAALGYHGNGVAMASHAGKLIADEILGRTPDIPEAMRRPPGRFPFGRFRRALLAPAYWGAELFDL
ncbi:FAD-binding oxidoreductase [Cognatishimia sp. F0-27]|uniref:NAD(P)/FAD-dependent oxidoreductase n=1 Tax=Cognatishimia sp. F0-27 TaxID=2816855 RepID=UPI001D0CCC0A|nr:FAD-binding oxidoreductase [Cognatishimia sp. F0-27]